MLVCERLDIAGGVERFVCETAADLAAAGMDVSVATVDTPAMALRYPLPPAVRVLTADSPVVALRGPRAWQLLRAQWRIGRRLAELIRRERPDAVVLNGLTTACSVLLFGRDLAPHAICCDHNHFFARSRPWRWLRALLYPRVAAVVSLTQADAARFSALNPRTEVIYNASALRADAPALPSGAIVLAVGRHVAQKGLDRLLDAWPAVQAAVPAALLRIVGDGPLQPALRAQAERLGIAEGVAWMPPTPVIEAEYRAAAVFVLPSRYEGMPLALLEAQALGVPSVAFACPTGPAEILGADTGLLVPQDDVAALSLAIIELLQQRPLRERFAHAAMARSRERFSPDEHRTRWRSLVTRVAS
jgi:glycosyltransferase involved in cell wall biosynthesis